MPQRAGIFTPQSQADAGAPVRQPHPVPSVRRRLDRRAFMAAGLALAGCARLPPPVTPPAPPPGPQVRPAPEPLQELEPLKGYRATPYGLAVTLASHGCTRRPDIVFYVERRPEGARIAFARRRLDLCRQAVAGSVEITFAWWELGLSPRSPVLLLNPVEPGR
jgi:hypothetical protein